MAINSTAVSRISLPLASFPSRGRRFPGQPAVGCDAHLDARRPARLDGPSSREASRRYFVGLGASSIRGFTSTICASSHGQRRRSAGLSPAVDGGLTAVRFGVGGTGTRSPFGFTSTIAGPSSSQGHRRFFGLSGFLLAAARAFSTLAALGTVFPSAPTSTIAASSQAQCFLLGGGAAFWAALCWL